MAILQFLFDDARVIFEGQQQKPATVTLQELFSCTAKMQTMLSAVRDEPAHGEHDGLKNWSLQYPEVPAHTASNVINDSLWQGWSVYMLDCVHVHMYAPNLSYITIGYHTGPGYTLADVAHEFVLRMPRCMCEVNPAMGQLPEFRSRHHKANEDILEGFYYYYKACSSERPAFCLVNVFDKNNSDRPP